MHKSFFFLPCCFLLSSLISGSVLAQTSTQNQSKIVFQNNQAQFQIKSKNTGHDYLIQIYKPPVAPPQQGYPVLYILDGNATFPSAANIAQSIGAGSAKLGLDPLIIVNNRVYMDILLEAYWFFIIFFKSQMHSNVTLLQALLFGLIKACYFKN